MKKTPFYPLPFLLFIWTMSMLSAQNKLVGVSGGGEYGQGTIFSIDLSDTSTNIHHHFSTINQGSRPHGNLLLATNNRLYGISSGGGKYGQGVLFSLDTTGMDYQVTIHFQDSLGSGPKGSVIEGTDGKLYGMTKRGGMHDEGLIFSYDPLNDQYKVLHDFDGLNGARPEGDLLEASDGMLYGMTLDGGNHNDGALFSFDPAQENYVKLMDFVDSLGVSPYGNLIEASDGHLYGMSYRGGNHNNGVLFSYNRSTSIFEPLFHFKRDSTGRYPRGSLMEYNGKLYGMTPERGAGDGGCMFSYDLAAKVLEIELLFTDAIGTKTYGSLVEFNGLLFGMTRSEASFGLGSLFSFDPANKSLQIRHHFDGPTGAGPEGDVIFLNGKAYGMTTSGRTNGRGGIFTYHPSLNQFIPLLEFSPAINGGAPKPFLFKSSNGLYYGCTSVGGAYGRGLIYRFDPQTGTYQKLYEFQRDNMLGMSLAANGKMYGLFRGSSGLDPNIDASLFEFDPMLDSIEIIKDFSFSSPLEGISLIDVPFEHRPGKLIGTTTRGGTDNGGVIYEFDYQMKTYSVLYSFDDSTGIQGGLIMKASNGHIYGFARTGDASSNLLIFEYDLMTSAYRVIHEFQSSITQFTNGKLVEGDPLHLYGTIRSGSTGRRLFQIDLVDSTYTELHDFSGGNHTNPVGDLIWGSDQVLYGTSTSGNGAIYAFNLQDSSFYPLVDLRSQGVDGGRILFLEMLNSMVDQEWRSDIQLYPNPASQTLILDIESPNSEPLIASIQTWSGQVIWQKSWQPGKLLQDHAIDIQDLSAGLYIFRLVGEKGSKTIRLLKR